MPFTQSAEILKSFRGQSKPAGKFRAKREVIDLLHNLDCLPKDGRMLPAPELENAIALLQLAAKFKRVFQLPLPHANDVFFFGGEIAHQDFGLVQHSSGIVGVGGTGVSFRQAFLSCVGEAGEYLSFAEYPNDPLILDRPPSTPDLSGKLISWIAGGLGDQDWQPLRQDKWVELKQLGADNGLLLPVELCLRQAKSAGAAQRLAQSTGCAAGQTIGDAILSGLLEVIERDAVALWWYGGEPGGQADKTLYFSALFRQQAAQIRRNSNRKYWLLDITSDLKIPVIACLSSKADGSAVIAGFAAHTDFQIAAEKAFLEMCQMELAQDLAVIKQQQGGDILLTGQDRLWLARRESLSTSCCKQFVPKEKAAPPEKIHHTDHLAHAVERLKEVGLVAFSLDLTRQHIAIPVARVVVPGLQSGIPDWQSDRLKAVAMANKIDMNNKFNTLWPI